MHWFYITELITSILNDKGKDSDHYNMKYRSKRSFVLCSGFRLYDSCSRVKQYHKGRFGLQRMNYRRPLKYY